ncbi:MAG: DUF2268 domain-containing putative Zn-dependent protease [Tannerellaceae bacterium]|jgi:hypothetical protein|nr:DUF2268 domain-containing putative Zn-dependent protease [Tannerellaceae bacterium]
MYDKILYALVCLFVATGCKGQGDNRFASAPPVHIHRFDQALYQVVESDDSLLYGRLLEEYRDMLEVTGKGILNMRSPELPDFSARLVNYYSEPTLNGLYRDALALYDSVADIEQQLGSAFAYLKATLPSVTVPEIYMHVSGLNQNVLVAGNLLSISIDKYMGKEYPLYKEFFYDYQREKMQRSRIAPDYLAGWIMSEYPFSGKENVLLERMVYEGKINYLVAQAFPDLTPSCLMGYTVEEYEWCKEYERSLWKTIIGEKHVYTPDYLTTNNYFEDAPGFPASGAPGHIGTWIGWRIVDRYMKETKETPENLMRNHDAQQILTESKYNGSSR